MNPSHPSALAPCKVMHGASVARIADTEGQPTLHTALPVLGGDAAETILGNARPIPSEGDWQIFKGHDQSAGFAVAPSGAELEEATRRLYTRLLEETQGMHLYRVWNYVPAINRHAGGLENYARFCRGRSLSFEQMFGTRFKTHLPAASAVGAPHGTLAIAFWAGAAEPHHFENPRQVPAFEYPAQYGPRPPSFARATAVGIGGAQHIFISGTAAIRGHQTVAPNELEPQLTCMLENLATIAETAGAGANVGAGRWHRAFKVYVRRPEQFPAVNESLKKRLLLPGDRTVYLQADICRSALLVEIEAVLTRA